MKATCAHCTLEFEAQRRSAKYCGQRCASAAWRVTHPTGKSRHPFVQPSNFVSEERVGIRYSVTCACTKCGALYTAQRSAVRIRATTLCADCRKKWPEAQGGSDDFSLLVRKWTPAERQSVLDLRATGLGPLAISRKLGIPVGQVRFWVYGGRPNARRSPPSTNRNAVARRGYYRTKYQDWAAWRGATFVSSSRARLRKAELPVSAPRPKEVRDWIGCHFPGNCSYCKVKLTQATFGIDHAVPLGRGGANTFENFRACCQRCNTAKGSMTAAEFEQLLTLLGGWEDGGKILLARLRSAGHQFAKRKAA